MKKTLLFFSALICTVILSSILVSCKSDDDHELTVKEQLQGRWEVTDYKINSSKIPALDEYQFIKFLWIDGNFMLFSEKKDFSDLMQSEPYTFDESTRSITISTTYDGIKANLKAHVDSINDTTMTWSVEVTAFGITIKATMTFKRL